MLLGVDIDKRKVEEEFIAYRMPMEEAGEAFREFKTPGAVNGTILLINDNK